jgi:hypothetical protein
MSGCDGSCCAAFTLPHPPEAIRSGWDPKRGVPFGDADVLASMLVPLTAEEADDRRGRPGPLARPRVADSG